MKATVVDGFISVTPPAQLDRPLSRIDGWISPELGKLAVGFVGYANRESLPGVLPSTVRVVVLRRRRKNAHTVPQISALTWPSSLVQIPRGEQNPKNADRVSSTRPGFMTPGGGSSLHSRCALVLLQLAATPAQGSTVRITPSKPTRAREGVETCGGHPKTLSKTKTWSRSLLHSAWNLDVCKYKMVATARVRFVVS